MSLNNWGVGQIVFKMICNFNVNDGCNHKQKWRRKGERVGASKPGAIIFILICFLINMLLITALSKEVGHTQGHKGWQVGDKRMPCKLKHECVNWGNDFANTKRILKLLQSLLLDVWVPPNSPPQSTQLRGSSTNGGRGRCMHRWLGQGDEVMAASWLQELLPKPPSSSSMPF